eukprot:6196955-Pleurochrysis_carterae.AAC.1
MHSGQPMPRWRRLHESTLVIWATVFQLELLRAGCEMCAIAVGAYFLRKRSFAQNAHKATCRSTRPLYCLSLSPFQRPKPPPRSKYSRKADGSTRPMSTKQIESLIPSVAHKHLNKGAFKAFLQFLQFLEPTTFEAFLGHSWSAAALLRGHLGEHVRLEDVRVVADALDEHHAHLTRGAHPRA